MRYFIVQDKYSLMTPHYAEGMGCVKLNFSEELIKSEIGALENGLKTARGKININNGKNMLKYLKKLLDNVQKGKTEVGVIKDSLGNYKVTPPILYTNMTYGLDAKNYLVLEPNQLLISFDFTVLANLMTFDMAYQDMGYTKEEVESILKDNNARVSGFNDISTLGECYSDIMYEYQLTKVANNPTYFDLEDHTMLNYYLAEVRNGNKLSKDKTYGTVLRNSIHCAIDSMLSHLFSSIKVSKHNINIIQLDYNSVLLLVEDGDDKLISAVHDIMDNIVVRCCGLFFHASPTIEII